MRYLIGLLLLLALNSCAIGERIFGLPDNPPAELDLSLTYFAKQDTIHYSIDRVISEQAVNQAIRYGNADTYSLVKSLVMTAASTEGDTLTVEIWFHYGEKPVAEVGDIALVTGSQEWDYVDQEREVEDYFGNEALKRRIIINNTVSFDHAHSTILNTRSVLVNDKAETWLKMELAGESYGWYSPDSLPYYSFEGRFTGVIK